jgi:hypothetical protein
MIQFLYYYRACNRLVALLTILAGAMLSQSFGQQSEQVNKPFVHPGMAQSRQDLDRMRDLVLKGAQPWKDAFERLEQTTSAEFVPRPYTRVAVGAYGANGRGGSELFASAAAAYNNALLWYITRDKKYALKAIDILNAWSARLWSFDGNNAKLNVGLSTYNFLNAAELLKYTNSGWQQKDVDQFNRMLLTVYYPTIKDFFAEANGNWDASMINSMLCIGVFLNNHQIFERAVERYYHGPNNSGITKYIYPTGQPQETTRDWGHVQLGIGEFQKAAQVAWTQGLNLYGAANDRLALGYEYTAKYMLGEDVPVYGVISTRERDKNYRDIYEPIFEHYRSEGISMPYTEKVIKEKTSASSTLVLLTSVRDSKLHVKGRKKLLSSLDITPEAVSNAGAGANPGGSVPADALIIMPGDSIQAAIDAAAGKGRWVVLGKGVHLLKAPLVIPNNLTLTGLGQETILMFAPKAEGAIMVNGDKRLHDVTIRDLVIEGGNTTGVEFDPNNSRRLRSYMNAQARSGIEFIAERDTQMYNLCFDHVTVQNFTKSGIAIFGARKVAIRSCNFTDNGASVVPGPGLMHNLYFIHSQNIDIRQSRFDNSPFGDGISFTSCARATVVGCECCRNKLSGIGLLDCKEFAISGSLLEGNDEYGVSVQMLTGDAKKIKISHTRIQYNTKNAFRFIKAGFNAAD